MIKPLNIFYEEPDEDRWFKYDRYPRKFIRRIIRGKPRPGGVMMIAINLMKGFDKLGIPYRFNDYPYIRKHPSEIACIIGKHQVLFDRQWENPVIFGAGIYSHPIECPNLLTLYPNVKRVLVPGNWMKEMFIPYYGEKVTAWPVGTDSELWRPNEKDKKFDFLIYYKIRWEHEKQQKDLVGPILKALDDRNLTWHFIKYGNYSQRDLIGKVGVSKAVIFLCEHETQGLAYQQILATNTPIIAWDRGGFWQDPYYYPHRVQYQPVSSVPYWDERCGTTFRDAADFNSQLDSFLTGMNEFNPRQYFMENLTLEICAKKYLKIYKEVEKEIG